MARNGTYETTNANTATTPCRSPISTDELWLTVLANYTGPVHGDQHAPQNSQFNAGYRGQWLKGFGIKGDYGSATPTPPTCGTAATYGLPFGRGKLLGSAMNRAADLIVGGWRSAASTPSKAGSRSRSLAHRTTADFGCSANVVAGQSLYAGPHNYTQWLNPARSLRAYGYPSWTGRLLAARWRDQQVRGPHYTNLDAALLKNFTVTESFRFQFRAEAFNITNTPPSRSRSS